MATSGTICELRLCCIVRGSVMAHFMEARTHGRQMHGMRFYDREFRRECWLLGCAGRQPRRCRRRLLLVVRQGSNTASAATTRGRARRQPRRRRRRLFMLAQRSNTASAATARCHAGKERLGQGELESKRGEETG